MSTPLQIFAIEDNLLHQEQLRITLRQLQYELTHLVPSAEEALPLLKNSHPDVIVLDIDLAGTLTGIDLGHTIHQEYDIPIIYLTAFRDADTFARASTTYPYAYLVKPIKASPLQRSIELAVQRQIGEPQHQETWPNDIWHKDTFFVKIGNRLLKLLLSDVHYIQSSSSHYSEIITAHKKAHVRSSLSQLEARLTNKSFVRIHRSYLINLEHVELVHEAEATVTVGGTELPLGKTYRQEFLRQLPRWS